ncbi:MAG TPA: hypothetical protein VM510_04920 [Caulifigura sp.]|nr:hypothetical protein [Caulifigura sp.]
MVVHLEQVREDAAVLVVPAAKAANVAVAAVAAKAAAAVKAEETPPSAFSRSAGVPAS